jgi:transcriptional regulator with XRE-family HTH domain
MTTIDEKILKALHARGWTQAELGRRIKVDKSQINRWFDKSKNSRPTAEQIILLSGEFGLSLRYLMDDAMDEEEPLERPVAAKLDPDTEFLVRLGKLVGVEEAARRIVGVAAEGPPGRLRGEIGRAEERGDADDGDRKEAK